MQNDLLEFYAMVDFTNPGILGTPEEFRRRTMFPILRGREPDATGTWLPLSSLRKPSHPMI